MYPFTAYPRLLPHEYSELCGYIESITGIVLGEGKEHLVSSRLGKLLRDYRLDSFSELIRTIRTDENMALRMAVIDAMTSKEAAWFRDMPHFRLLTNTIMPEAAKGVGTFRVWSVACASGQEPYAVAMSLAEFQKNNPAFPRRIDVVATDFSEAILTEAKRGLYCSLATVEGVNDELRKKFFIPNGDCSEVRPDIKRMVNFRKLNLLDSYEGMGRFDVIFCRNVLVYFSQAIRTDALERMIRTLKPGGYLFLGAGEPLDDPKGRFEQVIDHGGCVYRLKPAVNEKSRRE